MGMSPCEQPLGEHQHEPLLHRRPRGPEHAAQGEGDDDAHDDRGHEPAVAGEPGRPAAGAPRSARRAGRGLAGVAPAGARRRPVAGAASPGVGASVVGSSAVGSARSSWSSVPSSSAIGATAAARQADRPPPSNRRRSRSLSARAGRSTSDVGHGGRGHAAATTSPASAVGNEPVKSRHVEDVAVDVQYPLVPQVDAVGQHAQRHHRSAAQPAQRPGKRGTCEGHRQDDEEADGGVQQLLGHRGRRVGRRPPRSPGRAGSTRPRSRRPRRPAHQRVAAGPARAGAAARRGGGDHSSTTASAMPGHEQVEVGGQPVDAGVEGAERDVAGVEGVHPVAEGQRPGGGDAPATPELGDQRPPGREPSGQPCRSERPTAAAAGRTRPRWSASTPAAARRARCGPSSSAAGRST